jgi:comEA protein
MEIIVKAGERFSVCVFVFALAFLFFAQAAAAQPQPANAAQKKNPPAHPLDLNSATIEQLEQVPGIGPKTAQAIVDFRRKSGAFRHVDDLLAIKGISQRKMEMIRPYVTVTHPAAKPN